jgi:glutamine cyclotransferase
MLVVMRRRTSPPTALFAPRRALSALAALTVVAGLSAACGPESAQAVPTLRPQVVAEHPHDPSAFTQGLEIDGDVLYESTGQYGTSWIAATDRSTGTQLARADLEPMFFGEGLTVTDTRVWQVTWRDGVAIARDKDTLAEIERVTYTGEGWGLCDRDGQLVMSDGTDRLTFRDPVTFAETGSVEVTRGGQPQQMLNELECAGDWVYANVWQTDEIVRIDPASGTVTAVVDAAGLLPPEDSAGADVLNGIAAIPGTDRFLLTGKYWPTVFEVTLADPGTDGQ